MGSNPTTGSFKTGRHPRGLRHHESATLDAHLGKGPGAHNPVVVAWVTATIAAGGLLLANLLALGPALAASRLRPAQLLRTQ